MVKIKEFQKILRKKKIDFFIAVNIDFERINYDTVYFSGYNGVGALIIPKKKRPFLIVHRMEAKKAKQSKLKVYCPSKTKRMFEFIKEKVKQNKIKTRRIGINKEEFTLLLKDYLKKNFKKSRLKDLRKELYKLREQKTKKEIEIIKKACKISDNILKKCFKNFKKFKTEAQVKAFVEYETKKIGCNLAFPTIVASGTNSSKAHHSTEDTKLKKGFCVIDFGIRYKNYCTDTTRTIFIGKPSKEQIKTYNFLLKAQKNIIKKIKLNKKCSKLFQEIKDDLGKYSKYFTHGLGHGLGVKIHEFPNLTEKSKNRIKENTTFTIEPAIYQKNFGIRIEDSILVTKKTTILTNVSKDLLTIN
jgi:Xaa-Pro aminopeptidase